MAKIVASQLIELKNACCDKSCYWHISHWKTITRSGCVMLVDASYCDEPGKKSSYMPYLEGLKIEHPEIYRSLVKGGESDGSKDQL